MARERSRSRERRPDCRAWQSVRASDLGDVIQLCVGGHHYVAARSTLVQTPYFQRLLEMQVTVDERGAIFVDRDGATFDGVLTWLRTQTGSRIP